MEVKGFKNNELNDALRISPSIVCEYISALQRVLDMQEETNKKAVAKIMSLLKEFDCGDWYSEKRHIKFRERLKASHEKAFIAGYDYGHNDTVESCYGNYEEKAKEYVEECTRLELESKMKDMTNG